MERQAQKVAVRKHCRMGRNRIDFRVRSASGTTLLSVAAPYVFALVVLVFAFEAGTASANLRLRPLVLLGTVSYSIYMTHVFIVRRMFDAGYQLGKLWHVDPFTHRVVDGHDTVFLGTQLWYGDIA